MKGKLSVGATLREVVRIYRDHFAVLLGLAFGVFLAAAIVEILLESWPLVLITVLVNLAATALYEAVVVGLVAAIRHGGPGPSASKLLRTAVPFVLPLTVVSILALLGIAVGFILLIAPAVILLTIWAVVVPVFVVERPGIWRSFGRSRELVEGNGMRVFAIVFMVILTLTGAALLTQAIGGDLVDSQLGRIAVATLNAVILGPVYALIAPVLYFRLREIGAAALAPVETPAA